MKDVLKSGLKLHGKETAAIIIQENLKSAELTTRDQRFGERKERNQLEEFRQMETNPHSKHYILMLRYLLSFPLGVAIGDLNFVGWTSLVIGRTDGFHVFSFFRYLCLASFRSIDHLCQQYTSTNFLQKLLSEVIKAWDLVGT